MSEIIESKLEKEKNGRMVNTDTVMGGVRKDEMMEMARERERGSDEELGWAESGRE